MEKEFSIQDHNFQKARLLIVEDNDDIWTITRFVLQKELPELQLDRVASGEHALHYVSNCIEQAHPFPKLILQDLYMPKREDGLRLLTVIRGQLALGAWPQLPIVITSSSADPNDIQACYRCGATSYIIKSAQPKNQAAVYQALRKFWWETSVLPLTEPHFYK